MRISALVTTYRRFDKCCRAIDAILRQTFAADEIIVVDNGSPEAEYLTLHERYADAGIPVTVVRLSRGTHTLPPMTDENGQEIDVACRDTTNVAIGLARGDWFAFCHDDDEWMPHRLEVQADALQKHRVGLIGCNIYNRTPDGSVGDIHHAYYGPHGTSVGGGVTDVTECLPRFNPLAVSGLLVSRAVVAKAGGWQHWVPDDVGRYMRSLAASDWDVYRRAAAWTPLLRVDEPLVWYEVGNVKHEGHMSYA